MSEYSELSTTIGTLKRAAIDAWMHDQGWDVCGDNYEMGSSSFHYKVTRPAADGAGGGDWSSDFFISNLLLDGSRDEDFSTSFGTIRSNIDALFTPWLDLPDPDAISDVANSVGLRAGYLSAEGGEIGNVTVPAGPIVGWIRKIEDKADYMSGGMIEEFSSSFVTQLYAVVSNHKAIALSLGRIAKAEEGLWDGARISIAEIIDHAVSAMEGVANGAPFSWTEFFTFAGFINDAVGIFIPAGKAATGIAGVVLKALKEVSPKEVVERGAPASYDEAMDALKNSIDGVKAQIGAAEKDFDDNLVECLESIRDAKGSYDLTADGISSSSGSTVLAIDETHVDAITDTYMPDVASSLATAGADLLGADFSTSVGRDASLGIGASGPSANWNEMRWLLYELLKNLSREVEVGAVNLRAAVDDILHHDATTASKLAEAASNFETAGDAYDPWE